MVADRGADFRRDLLRAVRLLRTGRVDFLLFFFLGIGSLQTFDMNLTHP